MKKLGYVLALMLLLVPAFAYAAPPGCSWEGDPSLRYGWNYLDALPYHQPGPDTATTWAGGSITRTLGPYNAAASWLPAGCHAVDTLCFDAVSLHGWSLDGGAYPFGLLWILGPGYLWYQDVTIKAPCSAHIGDQDRVIARCQYANHAGVCDFSCGDCHDPNTRPADGKFYYSADTLYVIIVASPPALSVVQDSLTLVESGQTDAFIPFSLCNTDPCAPTTPINYSITSKGHIPRVLPYPWAGTVSVPGGECRDVYAQLNADTALVAVCTWDTLTCIGWMGTPPEVAYDTCVMLVHVVPKATSVPLFTVPVVTILVLALILAAAVFMRRRAVNRA